MFCKKYALSLKQIYGTINNLNFWVRIVIVIHGSIKRIYVVPKQILQNNGQFLITLYSEPVSVYVLSSQKIFLTDACVLCWWCSCGMCCVPNFHVARNKKKKEKSPSHQFFSPISALVSDKKADVLSWAKYHLTSYLFTCHPLGTAEMNCMFTTCFVLCWSLGW